jgi:hypothetical protein
MLNRGRIDDKMIGGQNDLEAGKALSVSGGISLLISLTGAFILISLDKLNKLTGFLNPLNTKESNFFTVTT